MKYFICFFTFTPMLFFGQSYNSPESIEYYLSNQNYYISNSSEGSILQWDGGNLMIFANDLEVGPHGLEIVGETLYACSGGTIKGYNLISGDQVLNYNLNGLFLNGITHNETDLYVTDFSSKRLYKYSIVSQEHVLVCTFPRKPNGAFYDAINNRIFVVSWGNNAPIYQVNPTTGDFVVAYSTKLGNIDGISMDGCGNIYISAWSTNSIHMFSSDFSSHQQVVSELNNPADIFYNTAEHILAIPNSGDNTVDYLEIDFCDNLILNDLDNVKLSKRSFDLLGRPTSSKSKGFHFDVFENGLVVKTYIISGNE